MYTVFSLFCLALVFSTSAAYTSFDELYEKGLRAYWSERWEDAISNLEEAVESYRHYKKGLSLCYKKCKNASSENPIVDQNRLGKIALKAACTRDCLDAEFGDFRQFARVLPDIKRLFEELEPYQYLQYAYYKEGMLAKSVSAAYTFSLRYPDDEMMKGNMEFFRKSSEVTDEMYINTESKSHVEKYNDAVQLYLKEDFKEAAKGFEEALKSYYTAVDDCHAFCEGVEAADEEQWHLDFYRQNAYHYIHVLECSLKCVRDLPYEDTGQNLPNYVPLQYHYMQFAYYQTNNIEKATECAKSYLVFYPNNSVVTENLLQFSRDVDTDVIQARKEALYHAKRLRGEAALLEYSYQNFGFKNYDRTLLEPFGESAAEATKEEPPEAVADKNEKEDQKLASQAETPVNATTKQKDTPYESMKEKTDDIIDKKSIEIEMKLTKQARDELHYLEPEDDVDITDLGGQETGYRVVESKYMVVLDQKPDEDPLPEGPLVYDGTVLVANSSQLKGRERFAVDGLAEADECQQLMDLEVSFGKPGDGYRGQSSPHTQHENFEGVTLLRAATMAKQGSLPLTSAMLYYDLSEKARAQVQAYFKLPHLYFDYTHLVCRTAKSDSPRDRNDLSHPVHADNCLLRENGECVKEAPAYTWRDYSAILYLNGDFLGGEFIFTDSTARRVRTMVKPKCGRMVSFGAGRESFHGVKPVISGRRCAVALWFTLSKDRDELQRTKARKILDELVSRQKDEL